MFLDCGMPCRHGKSENSTQQGGSGLKFPHVFLCGSTASPSPSSYWKPEGILIQNHVLKLTCAISKPLFAKLSSSAKRQASQSLLEYMRNICNITRLLSGLSNLSTTPQCQQLWLGLYKSTFLHYWSSSPTSKAFFVDITLHLCTAFLNSAVQPSPSTDIWPYLSHHLWTRPGFP